MLTALWPSHWSRQQRSNATLVSAVVLMVLALALLGKALSFLPEPIGPNAQAFRRCAPRWLTLVSGALGLVLARQQRWRARPAGPRCAMWPASIWVIRGTPLLVQILFVYFALQAWCPGLNPAGLCRRHAGPVAQRGRVQRRGHPLPACWPCPRPDRGGARPGPGAHACVLRRGVSQAFKIALPPLVSNFVALLKDSSWPTPSAWWS